MTKLFIAIVAAIIGAVFFFAAGSGTASAMTQAEQKQQEEYRAKSPKVTVQRGDTLIKIAKKHDTTYPRLFDANTKIKDPDIIHPGDKVRVPHPKEQLKHRELPAGAAVSVKHKSSAIHTYRAPVARTSYKPVSGSSVWDRLAGCESGGNWSYNGGSGYDGGLQFLPQTWTAYNKQYAYAWQAPREVQIATAEKLLAASGWGQWPACTAKLGLR